MGLWFGFFPALWKGLAIGWKAVAAAGAALWKYKWIRSLASFAGFAGATYGVSKMVSISLNSMMQSVYSDMLAAQNGMQVNGWTNAIISFSNLVRGVPFVCWLLQTMNLNLFSTLLASFMTVVASSVSARFMRVGVNMVRNIAGGGK